MKLTDEQLREFKNLAFDYKKPKVKLTKDEQRQFIAYMNEQAQKYPSGHSMQYTYLRDALKFINLLK